MAPTLPAYDDLLYDSVPLPETHPEYVAALAHLAGFAAADPCRAQILELGCAAGGNLLPIAWYAPESHCLGVELSRAQAEAGQALIAAAGLINVRIAHADLTTLHDTLGEFDYIIAHGLYSWVSPTVQSAILRLCARHLASHGIAYISYNVLPGWESRQALRAHLLRQVALIRSPTDQVRAARKVLETLAADWDASPLHEFSDLPAEINFLRRAADGYLFHEYLADINEPLTVGEFLVRVQLTGLDYLGDASAGLCRRQGSLRAALAEQQFDEHQGTRFRRSLLVRHGITRHAVAPETALDPLAFHADLRCDEEVDLGSDEGQVFSSERGAHFSVSQPLSKAALIVLAAIYPDSIRFGDLLEAARGVLQQFGATRFIDQVEPFREEWQELLWQHAVSPSVNAHSFFGDVSATPQVHALARAQAIRGAAAVAGAHHAALEVDALARELLMLLDGTRSRSALNTQLASRCGELGLALSVDQIALNCDRLLQVFARNGLLIA